MPSTADDAALLELAARLAWQAAELILGISARGFSTSTKTDRSPVTEADHAAEALITAGLRDATPLIPIVAEEEIAGGYIPRPSRTTWFVDPLDGTRDFAAGRDSFCVNIGLVREAVPVLGAVALPATAELFGGIVGVGAWKQDGAARRPITVRPAPKGGLVVLASHRIEDDPRLREFLRDREVASVTPSRVRHESLPHRRGCRRSLRALRPHHGVGHGRAAGGAGGGRRHFDAAGRHGDALRQARLGQSGLLRARGMTRSLAAVASGIAAAAALLRAGRLVAFGTETVYGLGGDATNGRTVAAIFAAKGRPHFNPLICHFAQAEAAFALVHATDNARALAAAFLAGAAYPGFAGAA